MLNIGGSFLSTVGSIISLTDVSWRRFILVSAASASLQGIALAQPTHPAVIVGRFIEEAAIPPEPWHLVQFDRDIPMTHYRIMHWDGTTAIEATADASMALLARPLTINLDATPVLCWRWRVDAPLKTADMARKSGDDYAARVYVAFDLPDEDLSWQTKLKLGLAKRLYGDHVPEAAINYVWDNRYAVGTRMPNAYTERTQMLVLQSGAAQSGRWINERRNVLMDAQQAFGKLAFKASLLAVASDTDDTGEYARAGFTDLHFVGAETPCHSSK